MFLSNNYVSILKFLPPPRLSPPPIRVLGFDIPNFIPVGGRMREGGDGGGR